MVAKSKFPQTTATTPRDLLRDPADLYFPDGCALPGLHSQPLVSRDGSSFTLTANQVTTLETRYTLNPEDSLSYRAALLQRAVTIFF